MKIKKFNSYGDVLNESHFEELFDKVREIYRKYKDLPPLKKKLLLGVALAAVLSIPYDYKLIISDDRYVEFMSGDDVATDSLVDVVNKTTPPKNLSFKDISSPISKLERKAACKHLKLRRAPDNVVKLWRMRGVFADMELKTGVPSYIIACFMLKETGMDSDLLKSANNPGGIKAQGDWDGDVYRAWDDCGLERCEFRKYPTLDDGIKDWIKILKSPRYSMHQRGLDRDDEQGWLKSFSNAGKNGDECYWSIKNGGRWRGFNSRLELIEDYNLKNL